ncbi:iron-containing alcohol dehydrogenase [Candidatus Xianfuyuplasma coldseepsis]|uniref:Iron-containing alcohol dehydrogenase n=1 Tax=Candidatus Xianfuyuplasma coldseepsis TaxID=2782163 RepID=A0A7L7KSA5_9MOLU|nr:iron-containing alcohol dehydrogenase [Xianfuyuplasma coldseepsis]QMS85485.1 iron-containing alcohol dehydrogenase [Xianfuyuplasma coldseepsis]
MINFTYQNPTKMVFGKLVEEQVGELTKKYGKKILLHYGSRSIKQYGLYDRIIRSLQAADVAYVELGGVIANPSLELVYEGIKLCKKEHVDFILAVGGGSVIDSAKAIAMGVYYPHDVWDFYVKGVVPKQALPIGTVLTIPAAGSESSIATVITNYKAGLKRACRFDILRPVFAVMNPEITMTLPPYQTASGVIDMIGHVIERYFTNTSHVSLIDRMSEGLIRTVIEQGRIVMNNPTNYDARAEIMLAGALAHNGSLGVGRIEDWACHNMEYEITQVSGISHGHGLAILYPVWMRYVMDHDVERFAMFANKVFDVPYSDDLETMARTGIDFLEAFYREMGMKMSLREVGITKDQLPQMADLVSKSGTITIGNFVTLDRNDILTIYTNAL